MAFVVVGVYAGALRAPFIFDDRVAIVENQSIVRLWPLVGDAGTPGPLNPPPLSPTARRPLPNLTFAINYRLGGLDPFGYHLVNLLLHVLAACLLVSVVRRTLQLPYFGASYGSAWALAIAAALVWAVHPLVSESVVNVTQRTELLGAVCYLAALWAALRYWSAAPAARTPWVWAAGLVSIAGMASKEVMVSAPIAVLLYERTFLVDSFRAARRSWPLYASLALGWVVLVGLSAFGIPGLSDERHRIPAWVWWITQTKILFLYLKLAVWPWPLSIHYAPDYLRSFAAAWPWMAAAAALAVATLALVRKRPAARWVLLVVVFVLGPTLVVPLPKMIAAERRMYLPLAGLVVLAVVGGYRLLASRKPADALRLACSAAAVLALGLGVLTIRRVAAYETAVTIWRDAATQQPTDAMSHYNLAVALLDERHAEEAIVALQDTLRLEPDHVMALDNLGNALERLGRPEEAVAPLEEAIRLDPHDAVAHNNLGSVLIKLGRPDDAVAHLREALALMGESPEVVTWVNLGRALVAAGRAAEAIAPLEQAVLRHPDDADASTFLGHALLQAGRAADAVPYYQRVVDRHPDDPAARNNLAAALLHAGRPGEAVPQLERAVALQPDYAAAQYNLGRALLDVGRPADAARHLERAARLDPADAHARYQSAIALARVANHADAALRAQEALALARQNGDTALAAEIAAWLADGRPGAPTP